MTRIKVLLAEDDRNLGMILKAYLDANGCITTLCQNGQEAWNAFGATDFDFCITDIMMPVMDGYALAKQIKSVSPSMPLVFLTAKKENEDILEGFRLGADDYVTKPFSMEELLARLNATIRRSFDDGKPDKNLFHIGNIVFDYAHQTLTCGESVQKLTMKESELLRMFAMNFNQLVDRTSTLQKIWKDDSYFAARSMDVYITKLRKYLKVDPTVQIVNVHGVGFRLTVKNE